MITSPIFQQLSLSKMYITSGQNMIFHSCKKRFYHASKAIFDKKLSPIDVNLSEETMDKILIEQEK